MVAKEAEPDEEPVTPGLQGKGFGFDENTRKIILALNNSRYTWRSVSGVAQESGLPRESATRSLKWLEENGLVMRVGVSKRINWGLTELRNLGTVYLFHYLRRRDLINEYTVPGILSPEFPVNLTCRCPAGELISFRGKHPDQNGHLKVFFEGRLLQCRHCALKTSCMTNPESANHRKANGRQVSFIIEKSSRAVNFTDWMKRRVDSVKGKQIYSHRMSVVEPVFGNIVTNKGLNRFSLRGKSKVQGQWQLYCVVHNIEKLKNYGELAL